jgi:pimeloyl-ACP methyl ester carboxylesterase
MLHGLFVTQHEFRRVIPELAWTRRVLAIDLPGCGESDRPLPARAGDYSPAWLAESVRKVLERLGMGEADVLGHGMGGIVALCLAAQKSRLVRRLVLIGTACHEVSPPRGGRLAFDANIGLRLWKTLFRKADLRDYLAAVLSTPELLDEDALDLYWDRLARRGGREATHAILAQLQNLDQVRGRLGDIRSRTMAIRGDRDQLVGLDAVEKVVDRLPDAELRVIDGCGHAPNEERPDALVELVLEHLGG